MWPTDLWHCCCPRVAQRTTWARHETVMDFKVHFAMRVDVRIMGWRDMCQIFIQNLIAFLAEAIHCFLHVDRIGVPVAIGQKPTLSLQD